jgi:sugar phosphate isomerase/epimerase
MSSHGACVASLASVVLLFAHPVPRGGTDEPNLRVDAASVKEVRLLLDADDHGSKLEYAITDPTLIRKVLLDPLAAAKADPKPLNYAHLGDVRITHKDGTVDTITLFSGLGRLKYKGRYFVADLSPLRTAFQEAIEFGRKYNKLLFAPRRQ